MAVGQKGTILGVLALAALVSGVVFETHPAAQELEEAAGPEDPDVTEKELQLYIDVYKAMQSDHSLTIESALTAQGVTVDEFRAVEQRIQRQERLVQNVRQALLEHAKAHASAIQPPIGSATAGSTP